MISQLDKVRIYVYVEQKDATYLKDGYPVEISLFENANGKIPATVTRISGELDPKTRMMLTEIDLDNSKNLVIPGSFVQVNIQSPGLPRLQIPRDFDADTPAYENIGTFARASAAAALVAMQAARAGENVFSLMRPPGHHATREQSMGFCYLNNVAIAALEAAATGAKRVAVFDFDVHHGNGTEDILRDQPGIAFFSVHQHPCYPGTGAANVGQNCFNYPVAPSAPRETYRATLARALADLKNFSPDLIAVSAGFETHAANYLGASL